MHSSSCYVGSSKVIAALPGERREFDGAWSLGKMDTEHGVLHESGESIDYAVEDLVYLQFLVSWHCALSSLSSPLETHIVGL